MTKELEGKKKNTQSLTIVSSATGVVVSIVAILTLALNHFGYEITESEKEIMIAGIVSIITLVTSAISIYGRRRAKYKIK